MESTQGLFRERAGFKSVALDAGLAACSALDDIASSAGSHRVNAHRVATDTSAR